MTESYPLKPSRGLARELNKVEEAANALSAVMGEQNYRPPDFPENALNAMLAGLIGISDVSVDGADDVLRAAMRRLPSYTTDYLQDLDEVKEDEMHGAWVRDGDIEQGFDKLIGAATKALHEVNKQKRQLGNEEPLPERAIDNALEDVITHEAINLSIEADDGLKGLHKAAKETLPDTEINENFERRVWDAKSVNDVSRSELAHPKFTQEWSDKIGKALDEAPTKIDKALEAVRKGPAKDLDKFYKRLQETPAQMVVETLQNAVQAFGSWRENRKGLTQSGLLITSEKIPEIDQLVQTAAEGAATRLLVFNQPVPDDIALNVRNLDLSNTEFSKIELLSNFVWLLNLNAGNEGHSKILDISGLQHLRNLQVLSLRGAQMENISIIGKLQKLFSLDIAQTQVRNIDVLKTLTELRALYLDETLVQDIAPLKKLIKLRDLSLSSTRVSEINKLEHLKELRELYLSNTLVSDISVLENLVDLRALYLSSTPIRDIGPLGKLTNLQWLDLGNTLVRKIAALEKLTGIRTLNLAGTLVKDIGALENLKGLEILKLSKLPVTDWSPVGHVKHVFGRPKNWADK